MSRIKEIEEYIHPANKKQNGSEPNSLFTPDSCGMNTKEQFIGDPQALKIWIIKDHEP